jgi:rubrerythrin
MAALLYRFSLVEADSAWQMLQAMDEVDDPEYRAELFNNALEEIHHAYLFKNQANLYAKYPVSNDHYSRKKILGDNKDLLSFKVQHYLGEKDVYEQFLTYSKATPKEDVQELFMEIRGDEEEHQRKARIKLLEELGSENRLRQKISKVRLQGLYQSWIDFGKWMGDISSRIILSSLYLLGGVFLKAYCRSRMKDPALNTLVSNILQKKSI